MDRRGTNISPFAGFFAEDDQSANCSSGAGCAVIGTVSAKYSGAHADND